MGQIVDWGRGVGPESETDFPAYHPAQCATPETTPIRGRRLRRDTEVSMRWAQVVGLISYPISHVSVKSS